MTASSLIRKATAADAAALTTLARKTFCDTFGHLYSAQDLTHFLDTHYTPMLQRQEITAPDNHVMVVEKGSELVGYAQSGRCKLPVEDMPQNAYELQRLYLLPQAKGQGLGSALLQDALAFFRKQDAAAVYVGVWSENYHAQAFYAQHGFEKIAEYHFMVGSHSDDEWIMQLRD